jgi:hypothetical protein
MSHRRWPPPATTAGRRSHKGLFPSQALPRPASIRPRAPPLGARFFPITRAPTPPLLLHGDIDEPTFLCFFILFGFALKFLTSRDTFPCSSPSTPVVAVPPPRHFHRRWECYHRWPPQVSTHGPLAMKRHHHATPVPAVAAAWLPHRRKLWSARPLPRSSTTRT